MRVFPPNETDAERIARENLEDRQHINDLLNANVTCVQTAQGLLARLFVSNAGDSNLDPQGKPDQDILDDPSNKWRLGVNNALEFLEGLETEIVRMIYADQPSLSRQDMNGAPGELHHWPQNKRRWLQSRGPGTTIMQPPVGPVQFQEV
ncbi:MAG: hypothetical protein Q9220_005767 [cf. Caloplaca sp. 1 TL-2023]